MHLDAMAIAVIDRAMDERADVEIATEFAIDPVQHIEIEARGNAGGVVIGVIKGALVFLQIDTDHHPRVFAQNRASAFQERAGFTRFEIAKRRAGKKAYL